MTDYTVYNVENGCILRTLWNGIPVSEIHIRERYYGGNVEEFLNKNINNYYSQHTLWDGINLHNELYGYHPILKGGIKK